MADAEPLFPSMSDMAPTVGQGDFRFSVDSAWAQVPGGVDLGDVADIAIGPDDDVVVLSRETANPIVVFDSKGSFKQSVGQGVFGRVHGITIPAGGGYFVADD